MPCRVAEDLACVFPIRITQCDRVWLTSTMSCRGLERSLAKRHGRSTAGARNGTCKSNTVTLCYSNGKGTNYIFSSTTRHDMCELVFTLCRHSRMRKFIWEAGGKEVGEATGDFKNVDNMRLDILTQALMISVFYGIWRRVDWCIGTGVSKGPTVFIVWVIQELYCVWTTLKMETSTFFETLGLNVPLYTASYLKNWNLKVTLRSCHCRDRWEYVAGTAVSIIKGNVRFANREGHRKRICLEYTESILLEVSPGSATAHCGPLMSAHSFRSELLSWHEYGRHPRHLHFSVVSAALWPEVDLLYCKSCDRRVGELE